MNNSESETHWVRYDKWALALLLLVGFLIRFEGIGLDLIDHHCFREGTEAMMARHFAREGIFLQYPKIDGYSAEPLLFINEFPLYPALMAFCYRIAIENVLFGRLISVAASLGSALVCYLLLRRMSRNTTPVWGTALFILSPLGSYVGRCVMRHPTAFFFMILSFYLWILWLQKPMWRFWFGALFSGALSILMNFANAYIGLPMLCALVLIRGVKGFFDRRVWLLAGLMLFPSVLWLKHAMEFGAWFMTGEGGVKQRDLGRFIRLEWLNSDFFESVGSHLSTMLLTPLGCFLAFVGLLIAWRSPLAWIARVWALTVFIYFGFDHYPIYMHVHDYYFVHALFPACLAFGLAGGALVEIAGLKSPRFPHVGASIASVVLGLLLLVSWVVYDRPLKKQFLHTEVGWLQHWLPASRGVRELTDPDAILVVDRDVDALIYLCDRRGWVADWKELTPEALESMVRHGADYLLITSYTMGEKGAFTGFDFYDPEKGSPAAGWVQSHGKVIKDGLVYQIVDLAPS
ncbi:MAG: hypothetical protein DIKNOCCD_00481 [bacterium]|nr:glycosyltransferase family 39 protein [bacterium]MBV6480773.1 hypothetical protein [bacterium]MCE7907602.1 phospholipid carrier-dependent glycosyltransferase [Candidatus Omnitrophica bacterium COP1]